MDLQLRNRPDTVVIIAAWNQLEKTIECLRSFWGSDEERFDVLLVDNGSDPPIGPQLLEQFPELQILRSEKNLGFSAGYNVGIREVLRAGYTYQFILNNDTALSASTVIQLRDHLAKSDSAVVGVMPKIYYLNDQDRIWSVGCDFRPILKELKGDRRGELDIEKDKLGMPPKEVSFTPFCAIMFRRNIFDELGLFD